MTELFVGMGGVELTSGGGPAETITGIVDAAVNGGPMAVGAQTLTLGLQVLGFIDNPLQTLATSVFGWVLEHLGPLNLALDATTGDPAAVEDAAKGFVAAATQLDALARSHAGSLSCDLQTYFGTATGTDDVSRSARAFHGAMTTRFEDLRTASVACSGIATLITASGLFVATTRGVIRDLLAEFAWKRLEKIAVASAAGPLTFGGAAAWLLADSLVAQATALGEIYRRLLLLVAQLKHVAGKLNELSAILTRVLKSPLRQAVINNAMAETGKTMDKFVQQDRPGSAASAAMPPLPPQEKPVYGPPSNARWTTSGTLDE
ncbi:MAG: hypothetical protein WBA97_02345 [Actinophytocola sp.]|uniref:hypothetical protein n=1 Tax=Actinophytocola sp. TaxID=1872138 RepID=UPI003C759CED